MTNEEIAKELSTPLIDGGAYIVRYILETEYREIATAYIYSEGAIAFSSINADWNDITSGRFTPEKIEILGYINIVALTLTKYNPPLVVAKDDSTGEYRVK